MKFGHWSSYLDDIAFYSSIWCDEARQVVMASLGVLKRGKRVLVFTRPILSNIIFPLLFTSTSSPFHCDNNYSKSLCSTYWFFLGCESWIKLPSMMETGHIHTNVLLTGLVELPLLTPFFKCYIMINHPLGASLRGFNLLIIYDTVAECLIIEWRGYYESNCLCLSKSKMLDKPL